MKLVIFVVVLLLSNCITSVEVIESIKDTPVEDLVVVSAKFANEPNRLVLFDFNDPPKYKVIYAIPWSAINPRFSKDKSRILFKNLSTTAYTWNGIFNGMDLYYKDSEQIEFLDVLWYYPVWSNDSNKFYFGTASEYSLKSKEWSSFFYEDFGIDQFIAYTDDEKLLVYGYETDDPNKVRRLFFLNADGSHDSTVQNPIFTDNIRVRKGPVTKNSKSAKNQELTDVRWNEENELFVFTRGYFVGQIMIADMEGDLEIEIPGGDNSANPAWSTEGNLVLFEKEGNIMTYDLAMEKTKLLISPQSIGAVSLHSPDY